MKQTGIDIFIGYHGTDNKKSSYMAAQRICDIILNKSIKDGYNWEIFLYRYTDNTTKYEETHKFAANSKLFILVADSPETQNVNGLFRLKSEQINLEIKNFISTKNTLHLNASDYITGYCCSNYNLEQFEQLHEVFQGNFLYEEKTDYDCSKLYSWIVRQLNAYNKSLNIVKLNKKAIFEKLANQEDKISCLELKRIIVKFIDKNGLINADYLSAINTKYFIFGIMEELKQLNSDEAKFLLHSIFNSFLRSFEDCSIETLDSSKLRVLADENERLIQSMIKDDIAGGYYSNTRHAAKNTTNVQINYQNYLYGQLLKISYFAKCTKSAFAPIFDFIKKNLFDESSLDKAGGWRLYRFPWLTARILIALKSVNESEFCDKDKQVINTALESLLDRHSDEFFGKKNLWGSGASGWVPHLESTALCLEALMLYGKENEEVFQKTISELTNSFDDWISDIDFTKDQHRTNISTGNIMLASVLYRYLNDNDSYTKEKEIIKKVFKITLNQFMCGGINTLQKSTIPACLYYILLAIRGE